MSEEDAQVTERLALKRQSNCPAPIALRCDEAGSSLVAETIVVCMVPAPPWHRQLIHTTSKAYFPPTHIDEILNTLPKRTRVISSRCCSPGKERKSNKSQKARLKVLDRSRSMCEKHFTDGFWCTSFATIMMQTSDRDCTTTARRF